MTSTDLLPAAVLKRKAVVHIRQSTTQAQVQSNLESQRRQYELVDVAMLTASWEARSRGAADELCSRD